MRLTEELPMGSYKAKTIYLEPNRNEQECIYKLGQLEDIEDELRIDLITLFKALKGIENRHVYNKEEKCDVFVNTIIYHGNDLIIKGYASNSIFLVKDYGKTWALDKKDLEKE